MESEIKRLTKIVESESGSTSQDYYLRGNLFFKLKNVSKAIDDYDISIGMNPTHVDSYIKRGNCYEVIKKFKKSMEDYSKAIQINENYDLAYAYRFRLNCKLKRYREVLPDLSKCIELKLSSQINETDKKKHLILLLLERSVVYYKLNEFQNSIEDIHQVLNLDPNSSKAYENLSQCYLATNDYKQAIIILEKLISMLDPQHELLNIHLYNLAIAYRNCRNFCKECEVCTKILESDPEHLKALFFRGISFIQMGNKLDEAENDILTFERISDKKKSNMYRKNAKLALEDIRAKKEIQNRFKIAISNIESLKGGGTTEDYLQRGIFHMKNDDYHKAIEDFNEVLTDTRDPKNFKGLINRAISFSSLGEVQKSVDDFTKAIDDIIDPNLKEFFHLTSSSSSGETKKCDKDKILKRAAFAYIKRSYAYRYNKNYKEANSDLTYVLEKLDPENPADLYGERGRNHMTMRNFKLAIADFRKRLELTYVTENDIRQRKRERKIKFLQFVLPDVYSRLHDCYMYLNDWNSLVEVLSEMIEDEKFSDNVHRMYQYYYRSDAYLKLKKFEKARKDIFKAIQISPNSEMLKRKKLEIGDEECIRMFFQENERRSEIMNNMKTEKKERKEEKEEEEEYHGEMRKFYLYVRWVVTEEVNGFPDLYPSDPISLICSVIRHERGILEQHLLLYLLDDDGEKLDPSKPFSEYYYRLKKNKFVINVNTRMNPNFPTPIWLDHHAIVITPKIDLEWPQKGTQEYGNVYGRVESDLPKCCVHNPSSPAIYHSPLRSTVVKEHNFLSPVSITFDLSQLCIPRHCYWGLGVVSGCGYFLDKRDEFHSHMNELRGRFRVWEMLYPPSSKNESTIIERYRNRKCVVDKELACIDDNNNINQKKEIFVCCEDQGTSKEKKKLAQKNYYNAKSEEEVPKMKIKRCFFPEGEVCWKRNCLYFCSLGNRCGSLDWIFSTTTGVSDEDIIEKKERFQYCCEKFGDVVVIVKGGGTEKKIGLSRLWLLKI